MTAEKIYTIGRTDICMADPMPFNQHWEARIACPIDQIKDMGLALQSAHSSMRVGDHINVVSFVKNDWDRMTEVASFRIVSRNNHRMLTIQVTEIVKVPEELEATIAPEILRLEVVKTGNAFEARDTKGNTIEIFADKDQADAFVVRENARHKVTDQSKLDKSKWTIQRGLAGKHIVKNEAGEPVKEFPNKTEAEAFLRAA